MPVFCWGPTPPSTARIIRMYSDFSSRSSRAVVVISPTNTCGTKQKSDGLNWLIIMQFLMSEWSVNGIFLCLTGITSSKGRAMQTTHLNNQCCMWQLKQNSKLEIEMNRCDSTRTHAHTWAWVETELRRALQGVDEWGLAKLPWGVQISSIHKQHSCPWGWVGGGEWVGWKHKES